MEKMTAERWAKVRETVEAALGLPPSDRSKFVSQACSDEELRAEVEDLLQLQAEAEALFPEAVLADSLNPGTRIGAYQIVKTIGEGGMGTVYLAERADAAYSQKVAIKIVQRSLTDARSLERFVGERQTLARLNHPGIARLIDGGVTEDGRPYLVMEYVDGRNITRYCDQERVGVEERIRLVLRISEAVQSAHQNLIIHRDLKPANILVTADGEPKLLDFGIAKVLDGQAHATRSNATIQILTPAYASPEQALNQPVSTAADVYSLGVLLYELLTGRLPHPVTELPPHEAIRRLTETDPPLASDAGTGPWRKTLKGDLDTILQHALQRQPERRYPTVQAFAQDLNRYLLRQPVQAQRDTLWYRTKKLVQRRTAAVAFSAAAVVAIMIALALTWRAYRLAEQQRELAVRRYDNGRILVKSYLTEIDRALEGLPGSSAARNLIAQRNLEYLDRMLADAKGDVNLERELAQAFFLIARTKRAMAESAADRQQAFANMQKAVALRRAVFAATGGMEDRSQFAYALSQAGTYYVQAGELQKALALHQEACAIAQPIFAGSTKGLNWLRGANACWNVATDLAGNEVAPYLGRVSEGLPGQLEALGRFERWQKDNPGSPLGWPYVASMETLTAADYARLGQYAEARRHYERALSILHGPNGGLSNTLASGYLANAELEYAMLLIDAGAAAEALPHAREAFDVAKRVSSAQNGADAYWRDTLATASAALARALAANGSHEAMQFARSGLRVLQADYRRDPSDVNDQGSLLQASVWAIDAARRVNDRTFEREQTAQVRDIAGREVARHPDNAFARWALASIQR